MEPREMIYVETEYMIYGKPTKYYSYYCKEKKYIIVTDNYDEYITQSERNKMGGNEGIHLVVFPEQDPPLSSGPQFVK
jgi:hypothetical protein